MTCYTAHVISGATLLCNTIKVNTTKRYSTEAVMLSEPALMVNPCLDLNGKTSQFILDLLHKARI